MDFPMKKDYSIEEMKDHVYNHKVFRLIDRTSLDMLLDLQKSFSHQNYFNTNYLEDVLYNSRYRAEISKIISESINMMTMDDENKVYEKCQEVFQIIANDMTLEIFTQFYMYIFVLGFCLNARVLTKGHQHIPDYSYFKDIVFKLNSFEQP